VRVYIFDLKGTLTVLPDPVGFVHRLKAHDPEAHVVLWSGTVKSFIAADHPGLMEAVDAVWEKPCDLVELLEDAGWGDRDVVISENEPLVLRAAVRMLRGRNVLVVPPEGLEGLLLPPGG